MNDAGTDWTIQFMYGVVDAKWAQYHMIRLYEKRKKFGDTIKDTASMLGILPEELQDYMNNYELIPSLACHKLLKIVRNRCAPAACNDGKTSYGKMTIPPKEKLKNKLEFGKVPDDWKPIKRNKMTRPKKKSTATVAAVTVPEEKMEQIDYIMKIEELKNDNEVMNKRIAVLEEEKSRLANEAMIRKEEVEKKCKMLTSLTDKNDELIAELKETKAELEDNRTAAGELAELRELLSRTTEELEMRNEECKKLKADLLEVLITLYKRDNDTQYI